MATAEAKVAKPVRPTSRADIEKKLKELHARGGEILYERVGLLCTLIHNDEYRACFNGDRGLMISNAQTRYFDDLAGLVEVDDLVGAYELLGREIWQLHRWNMRRIISAYRQKVNNQRREEAEKAAERMKQARKEAGMPDLPEEVKPPTGHTVTRATIKELEQERSGKKQAEAEAEKERTKRETMEEKCKRLEEKCKRLEVKCAHLEEENAVLRGRVQALEQLVRPPMVAAAG